MNDLVATWIWAAELFLMLFAVIHSKMSSHLILIGANLGAFVFLTGKESAVFRIVVFPETDISSSIKPMEQHRPQFLLGRVSSLTDRAHDVFVRCALILIRRR